MFMACQSLSDPGISKQGIREKIWDYLESQNLAEFPRPVHHRIPNFKGSYVACQNIKELEAFARTQDLKVDPDKPLEGARLLALQSKKTLLVPTPRLRTGLFNKIVPPPGASKDVLRKCATSQGVRNYSVPIGLDSKVHVDLVVVGSVAVSEKGWRIGKGEGYADLEYAMMVAMGAVSEGTPVVTIVHDCQVVDIPEELLEDHDLTVDYILTPTRVISTGCARPKPWGIAWSKISCEMMEKIPILRSLRCREKQAGKDVSLQDEQRYLLEGGSQQTASQAGLLPRAHTVHEPPGSLQREATPSQALALPTATVFIGNLPQDARVSELKAALRERDVVPLELSWQGPQHRAFLSYRDLASAQRAISCLQGLHLGASILRVELAKPRGASDLGGSRARPERQPLHCPLPSTGLTPGHSGL
ncbi:methenyltetrahydrofolate synthase domain-containing protein isoform X1 [Tamandua tetradactyla]|uniref:methenyltetrahydrofolate synthase domain-containing protein isoform X1 n=1 Tax=Tamandua tetradactyla TaxID=48850 RepID=UPI0040538A72